MTNIEELKKEIDEKVIAKHTEHIKTHGVFFEDAHIIYFWYDYLERKIVEMGFPQEIIDYAHTL